MLSIDLSDLTSPDLSETQCPETLHPSQDTGVRPPPQAHSSRSFPCSQDAEEMKNPFPLPPLKYSHFNVDNQLAWLGAV